MSVLIFIIVLSILVIVHEWGHYITAVKLGIKVEKFSVGFGPKLWSCMRGDTEFMVCAIPLGGYVKMAGDDRTQLKGTKDEFYSHSIGHRALVILMGPVVNIVFAYICFYFIFVTGFPFTSPRVGEVKQGYPAAAAGLMKGDVIKAIDGREIKTWEDMQEYIFTSEKNSVTVKIGRGSEELTKVVNLKVETTKNIFNQPKKIKIMGIQQGGENFSKEDVIFIRYGPIESLGKAAEHLYTLTVVTFKSLYYVIVGSIPAKDALGGPIRIFDIVRQMAEQGFTYLVMVTGVISANLAIFNLFPVPVLDGGHLFLLLIEKIRNRPLSLKIEENLTKFGLSLLLLLMLFATYNDFSSLNLFTKIQRLFHP